MDALTKSPNILIYTGKRFAAASYNELKELMLRCVGTSSYTIYHLKHEEVPTTPWQDNCQLVVVAIEQLYDGVDTILIKYFNSGGKILSFCSDLDKHFCNRELNDPSAIQVVRTLQGGNSINVMQGTFHYVNTKSVVAGVELSALATNSDDKVVVIAASNPQCGKCVFTQVHLEREAKQASVDKEVMDKLTETEPLRQSLVGELLERLSIDLDVGSAGDSRVTKCYIHCVYGQGMLKEFTQRVHECHPTKIKDDTLTIPNVGDFVLADGDGDNDKPLDAFDWNVYKSSLTSQVIGNTLLYQRITLTTQNLVEPFLFSSPTKCGIAAIASRQVAGQGRGGNSWLSPEGSLALSMHIRVDMTSNLGKSPALLQTIPAVSVACIIDDHLHHYLAGEGDSAVKVAKVRVKWPNDIYYDKVKIGGVLVKSSILQNTLHATVGIGVNVCNRKPTVNLNDVIDSFNLSHGTSYPAISLEFIASRICSEMERLIDLLNKDKSDFMDVYYKHWMHSGCRVDVPQEGAKDALIIGLDEHGFLQLRKEDGFIFSVQPDGNSFDIMHNLIKVKST